MSKAVFSKRTGKYTLIGLNTDYPPTWMGKKIRADGKEYDAEIVYDLPKHIAVRGDADFSGKEIEFI